MDDEVFVKQFRELKQIGVKQIIDFHAGCISHTQALIFSLAKIKRQIKTYVGMKNTGMFHGYARTYDELSGLYKKSGWDIVKCMPLGSYKYVTILE